MKKWKLSFFFLTFIFILSGCHVEIKPEKSYETVKDLIFEENNPEYRIYIQEGEQYVPFLVLEEYGKDNVLLLREFVLDDTHIYNKAEGDYPSYYATSEIDRFLNEDYITFFSEKTRNLIQDSSIEIASLKAYQTHNDDKETLSRKIFLLSSEETGYTYYPICMTEGSMLKYFRGPREENSFIATYDGTARVLAFTKKGEPVNWVMRTGVTDGTYAYVSIIGYNGVHDIVPLASALGDTLMFVRPAFCIPSSTPIARSSDIIEGKKVYILK